MTDIQQTELADFCDRLKAIVDNMQQGRFNPNELEGEIRMLIHRHDQSVLDHVEARLNTDLRAAERNLKYHLEITKSDSMFNERSAMIAGIYNCLDGVRDVRKQRLSNE